MPDKKFLIAGAGIVLMLGGFIVDIIKKKRDVSVVKQENRVPSPPLAKSEPTPDPEPKIIPMSKPESETKPEVKSEKNIEVIRADEKEAVLKINGKVYVYSKAGNKKVENKTEKTEVKEKIEIKKEVKKNKAKNEVKTKEEEKRLEEQIGSSIAIVCRADGKECSLYEGTKVYRVGDDFMGTKIKKIEIDKVYLDDGRIIILE